jgi:hypothetical protein
VQSLKSGRCVAQADVVLALGRGALKRETCDPVHACVQHPLNGNCEPPHSSEADDRACICQELMLDLCDN